MSEIFINFIYLLKKKKKKMEPLFVHVDSVEEAEMESSGDKTHCLLRVHTDKCLCDTDEVTAGLGIIILNYILIITL